MSDCADAGVITIYAAIRRYAVFRNNDQHRANAVRQQLTGVKAAVLARVKIADRVVKGLKKDMRMNFTVQTIIFSLLLGMLTVVPRSSLAGDDAGQAEMIEAGKKLVTKSCSQCHAVGEKGASTHADAPPFRKVVTLYPTEHLAEALGEGIISGHPDMPEFVFDPDEVGEILAYLDSLKVVGSSGQ